VTDRLDQLAAADTPGGVAGTNTIYVMSLPMQLGKFPIRYDVEIKPWTKSQAAFPQLNFN